MRRAVIFELRKSVVGDKYQLCSALVRPGHGAITKKPAQKAPGERFSGLFNVAASCFKSPRVQLCPYTIVVQERFVCKTKAEERRLTNHFDVFGQA